MLRGIGWKGMPWALIASLAIVGTSQGQGKNVDLKLTLPPKCFAVVGRPFTIFYDNIVLTQTPGEYRFHFDLEGDDQARHDSRSWTYTPTNTGTRKLRVKVADQQGKVLANAETTVRVSAADAAAGKSVRLLIIGDSLTHATLYPNALARLLSEGKNAPQWTFLGTHRPAGAAKGVAHEGYGGWTWQAFVSRHVAKPDPAKRIRSSRFVYVNGQGKPQLDVARYIKEECQNKAPDVVTFLLGINDCFSAPPDDPKKMDQRIDAMLVQAEILLKAFRQAAPKTKLAVCLTTPPNARQGAFEANYKDRYTRWGWRRIQHRLVQREIEQFAGREKENIYLIPTELNVDPLDGYPANNGVHPNAVGYAQIAQAMHAWMLWHFDEAGDRQ